METGALPLGQSRRGLKLTTDLHLQPRLWTNGATRLLPLCAFMAYTDTTLPISNFIHHDQYHMDQSYNKSHYFTSVIPLLSSTDTVSNATSIDGHSIHTLKSVPSTDIERYHAACSWQHGIWLVDNTNTRAQSAANRRKTKRNESNLSWLAHAAIILDDLSCN